MPSDIDREFICVGRAEELARFLAEYGLERAEVRGLVAERTPPGIGGRPGPPGADPSASAIMASRQNPLGRDKPGRRSTSYVRSKSVLQTSRNPRLSADTAPGRA